MILKNSLKGVLQSQIVVVLGVDKRTSKGKLEKQVAAIAIDKVHSITER